ncbi:LacI family DNA-binding transcriptional regulator [Paenibacillus cisolokensis]|uniref:LacI family DNA-binding transcriptional regulator n=1 Tax=Paenibacillus cisolokensis TaxID=1658519 RepID=UPI003D291FC7
MSKKVVMQDIADRLNISKNSVSQALSGKDGVSEATRKKIIQTAEEMGYRYTKKRKAATDQQHVQTIGLIASEFAFSMQNFFGEIYLAIEGEAHRNGINLLIQSVTPAARDSLLLPSFIENRQVDGILILSHISTDYINKIIDQGIPTVLIDHHHPMISADAVLTNNRFGAYTAVKHLVDLGHREIGIIGNVDASPSYLERWEGYRLALREHDIELNPAHVFVQVMEDGERIDEAISSVHRQPTAWFCLNDGFAFFVSSSLGKAGYRIPQDVSICGFDNSDFSQMSVPKMTTIDINLSRFAHKAFSQLMWRIQNRDEVVVEILLPTDLVVRGSTGKCRTDEHT